MPDGKNWWNRQPSEWPWGDWGRNLTAPREGPLSPAIGATRDWWKNLPWGSRTPTGGTPTAGTQSWGFGGKPTPTWASFEEQKLSPDLANLVMQLAASLGYQEPYISQYGNWPERDLQYELARLQGLQRVTNKDMDMRFPVTAQRRYAAGTSPAEYAWQQMVERGVSPDFQGQFGFTPQSEFEGGVVARPVGQEGTPTPMQTAERYRGQVTSPSTAATIRSGLYGGDPRAIEQQAQRRFMNFQKEWDISQITEAFPEEASALEKEFNQWSAGFNWGESQWGEDPIKNTRFDWMMDNPKFKELQVKTDDKYYEEYPELYPMYKEMVEGAKGAGANFSQTWQPATLHEPAKQKYQIPLFNEWLNDPDVQRLLREIEEGKSEKTRAGELRRRPPRVAAIRQRS